MPQGSHFLKLSDFIDFINKDPYNVDKTRNKKLLELLRTIIDFAKDQWKNISIVYVSINDENIKPTPYKILNVHGVSKTIEYPYEYTITEDLPSNEYVFEKSEDNIPIPKAKPNDDIIKKIIHYLKKKYKKTNNNYNKIYFHITSPENANGIITEGFYLNKANTGIDQEIPEEPSKKRSRIEGGTKRRNKRKRKTLKKKSRKTRRK